MARRRSTRRPSLRVPRRGRASGSRGALTEKRCPMATFPNVFHRLPDVFQIRLLLWIGAEVVLHLAADLILGLILETGVETIHVRVGEEVGRQRRCDAGRHPGYIGSRAVGWPGRRVGRGWAGGS